MLNNMKKNYVPITLDSFINESRIVNLKRKYGNNPSVNVSAKAPLRNQILNYVAENNKVTKNSLRKLILQINESASDQSISMWFKRNNQYFITETKNGTTFYKLSSLGNRLAKHLTNSVNESHIEDEREEADFYDMKKGYPRPGINDANESEDFDADDVVYPTELEVGESYYFIDEESDMDTKEIVKILDIKCGDDDMCDIEVEFEDGNIDTLLVGVEQEAFYKIEDEIGSGINESFSKKAAKVESILESLEQRKRLRLNEEETQMPSLDEADEFDIEIEDETSIEDNEERTDETEENTDNDELDNLDDLDVDKKDETTSDDIELEDEDENADEGVEITEFILTVDNVEEAIDELKELGVDAEKVETENEEGSEEGEGNEELEEGADEDKEVGEGSEGQIKVSAEHWDVLKQWLEDKGIDIAEMFGGDIEEVEETEDEESDEDENEEGSEEETTDDEMSLDDENEEGTSEESEEESTEETEENK